MTIKDGVAEWVKTKWKDIEVGNILKIMSGRQFPADLILLASSEPKGMAYIETSNLDGETNLKLKQALTETASFTNDEEIVDLRTGFTVRSQNKVFFQNALFDILRTGQMRDFLIKTL